MMGESFRENTHDIMEYVRKQDHVFVLLNSHMYVMSFALLTNIISHLQSVFLLYLSLIYCIITIVLDNLLNA